jgi:hypothetical protein
LEASRLLEHRMSRIPASLQALLANLIDYAGLYPPASLPLDRVLESYQRYLTSPESWMLNRLVLPASKLAEVRLEANWRITLLASVEPGPLPRQVETLETKAPGKLSLPTYCEVPVAQITDSYAKLRTGGTTPQAIPAARDIAAFLCAAAALRIPFKATAGLHHPIRSLQSLTGELVGPQAMMHGFLNVFVAACFAWQGMGLNDVFAIVTEQDPAAFRFLDDELRWRGSGLRTDEVESGRRYFAHSFGSCSFEEPVTDLRELGLLP